MRQFQTREEAFASQGFDPSKVKIEGVPPQHLEAAKAFINLCVAHDAVNPTFQPDYTNANQYKWSAWHKMGSPSGAGFRYLGYDGWNAHSNVGARLVSETDDAAEHIGNLFHEDYKAMKVYQREVK